MADPYAAALGLKTPQVSSALLSPDDQASNDAMERGPTGRDGFDLAYLKATPAQRVEMERSLRLAYSSQTPAQTPAQPDPYAAALGLGGATPASPAAPAAPKPLKVRGELDTQAAMGGAVLHGASALGATILGGWDGIQKLVEGGSLDDAVNAIQDTQRKYTYDPDSKSEAGSLVKAQESPYNPLNLPAKAGQIVGDFANKSGSPALATAADVATQALVPLGAARVARIPLRDMAKPQQARVEPTLGAPETQAIPQGEPSVQIPQQVVSPQPVAVQPVTRVPNAPAKPVVSDAANGVYAEAAPDAAGGIPKDEQTRRAQVLSRLGLNDVRASAITGDSGAASTDFQTSRLDSPAGNFMKAKLADEKAALVNYSAKIAEDTGGSPFNDQRAQYSRGEKIMQPLEGLSDWFDARTKALYDEAAQRAQGVPTQLDTFRKVLGDDSLATNSDRVQMRNAIQSYAKQLNILREDGSVFSDGQQAEAMRKYLNENWSPQNSGLVNKLKRALDEDVMSSAGEDVYSQARALWKLKKDTIDNPNGIARLLDSSGPNGINRKVQVEKVADTVTGMPVDQLSHIVETLNHAPPELQPQAQAALSEIKVQFAHNVHDIGTKHAGQWNSKGVQKYLDANSKRMQAVFAPEELQRFGTLNDAGNILAKDQSYPGAAAQHANLFRAGVSQGIQMGATGVGSVLGGPIGGAAGSVVGGKLAGKFNDKAEVRATQKRILRLSDMVQKPSEP